MNILFDGNYAFHRSFSVWSTYYQDRKVTPEENEERIKAALNDKEKQQVLLRKILIDFCAAINRFKDITKVTVVIDSTSWRYNFHSDYKYALTRVRPSYYRGFLNMIDMFEDFLRKKGIIVSRVMGAEGDDLVYLWSVYYTEVLEEDLVVVTADSDLRQIISPRVSIFCNNSKNLRMYTHEVNEVFWNEYFDADIMVETVKPFEILLYKVVMGDTSDNIPKLKKGFGDAAFHKFISSITPYRMPVGVSMVEMGEWIAERFCEFAKTDYAETLGKILFNLHMTWLNLSVYNHQNYISENGKSLLENILDDINAQCGTYSYNKDYSLESLYGMMIK